MARELIPLSSMEESFLGGQKIAREKETENKREMGCENSSGHNNVAWFSSLHQ